MCTPPGIMVLQKVQTFGMIVQTNCLFNFFYSNQLTKTCADELDTFIVYNDRRKVTSSAKRKRRCGDKSLHQVDT